MRESRAYTDVVTEPDISTISPGIRVRPDILATSVDGDRRILIECKSALTMTHNRLDDAVKQLFQYRDFGHNEVVLAVPARLTVSQKNLVKSAGFQVWDLDAVAERFRTQLPGIRHPLLRSLLFGVANLSHDQPSIESMLLMELRNLPAGEAAWVAYQKLVSRILERMFCPPLSSPLVELSDEPGINRRDIILPNYAENGFWQFIRGRYCADFIVADAKNFSSRIGKQEAIKMMNYLKRHGAGLLGIIVSRAGPDKSCLHTIKETWAHEGKMIVVLSDDHIERMLRTKEAGGPPEDVIRQWIEDFRLAM